MRVITPITTKGFACADDFAEIVRPDTVLSHVELDHGPASIESEFDEMLAAPETVAKIVEAERDGMDAVIINCMGDPGMLAGREAVSIPVIGPCEATMHVASMLGHTFSVITVLEHLRPLFENRAAVYGLRDKLASVRAVEIPVLELESDRDRFVRALADEAVQAIEEDGAHVMLSAAPACWERRRRSSGSWHAGLRARPRSTRWSGRLSWRRRSSIWGRHSKRTWPVPPRKAIAGYGFMTGSVAVAAD